MMLQAQCETGTDRYSLLQNCIHVSKSDDSNSPGKMNCAPFGQPFEDPHWHTVLNIAMWVVNPFGVNVGLYP